MSIYIPKDIVLQILRLLPVRSLLRFRSVCKLWNQIIDSEAFKLDHLALQNPKLFAEYEEEDFLILDSHKLGAVNGPFEDETKRRFHLVGTLHGLVCLYDDVSELFLIWNPSLKKYSVLRRPGFMDFDWTRLDGSSDGTCAGFWFDPFNQILKVIVFKLEQHEPLYGDDGNDDSCGGLYSTTERYWKRIPLRKVRIFHSLEATPPVVIQGVAHWRAQYDFVYGAGQILRDDVVVSFDFCKERFDIIRALSVPEGWDLPVLCSIEGGLSIVYVDPNNKCDIYLREQDSWVRVIGIRLVPSVSRVLWVEVEEGEGEKRNCRMVATMDDEMVLIDTKSKQVGILKEEIMDPVRFAVAHGYVESLLYVTNFIKNRS